MAEKPKNCLCSAGKFCKYHYSAIYYARNKESILQKQKEKYKKKKKEDKVWVLREGPFILNFS
jgi:hypothetical protein